MKRTIPVIGVILILLLSSLSFNTIGTEETSTVIYVDYDNIYGPWLGTIVHPYQYIQDAVDAAGDGDTVFVFNGSYINTAPHPYYCVYIDKKITLEGENKHSTIIDAQSNGHGIIIDAAGVYVSGFTIMNSGLAWWWGNTGILGNKHHITIHDNIIYNNSVAVSFRCGYINNCVISNNTIIDNYKAIYCVESTNFTIKNNNIISRRYV